MNKTAQIDFGVITFIGIVIVLIILAPIFYKVVKSTTEGFSTAINSTNEDAAKAVTHIGGTFTSTLDLVIVLAFVINVILLLITAFLIDTHPIFIIFYIMFCFFTIAFVPNVTDAVNGVWGAYAADVGSDLPLVEFLLDNFSIIILAVMVLSGIVIYAKIKYFSQQY